MTHAFKISGVLSIISFCALALNERGIQDRASTQSRGRLATEFCGNPGIRSEFNSAMIAGMEKMDRDMMTAPMTGDPGRDFSAMMIPHHQGAIDMAKAFLLKGKD